MLATQYGATIKLDDLLKAGLDLGVSTEEIADPNKEIWKMIGEHAYHINRQTQIVSLWKRK